MKKLFVIAMIAGAIFYFKPDLFSFNFSNGAFDKNGEPIVYLFTFDRCGKHCDKAIAELEKRQVDFEVIDVEASPENEKLYSDMGRGGMPYLVAGNIKAIGFNKHMYATKLAEVFGEQYLTTTERGYYQNHFYDDDTPLVYMYGASWCQYCKKMREEFESNDIDYFELDVEEQADQDRLTQAMGIGGYPTIFVGYRRIKSTMDVGVIIKAMKEVSNRKI